MRALLGSVLEISSVEDDEEATRHRLAGAGRKSP